MATARGGCEAEAIWLGRPCLSPLRSKRFRFSLFCSFLQVFLSFSTFYGLVVVVFACLSKVFTFVIGLAGY